ncbi:hypothetical protein GCM10022237_16840 [Nocardioides ginsengisoli]|jgi:hypothetical protein|uniref:DUF3311 domain-containing protein n=1 Tax=Nocardioides ginsengisoli TaxID=363868 RepID=A0ABW3W070_9ACTN
MSKKVAGVLPLVPVVLLIAGVPVFSGDYRIGPLPAIGSWFLFWVLVGPFFVLAADLINRRHEGDEL